MCRPKKTQAEIAKEVREHLGTRYKVMSEYIGALTPIEILHKDCGKVSPMLIGNIRAGKKCKHCCGNQPKSQAQFIREVKKAHGSLYEVVSAYQSNRKKVYVKCSECCEIFPTRPDMFLLGNGCPVCRESKGERAIKDALKMLSMVGVSELGVKSSKKTQEQYVSEVKAVHGDSITVLGQYEGAKKPIKIRCNTCGDVRSPEAASIIRGVRCKACAVTAVGNRSRKAHAQFAKEVEIVGKGNFKLLGTYTLNNKKVEMLCLKCDKEFPSTPNDFLKGHGCPHCCESKGERKIRCLLDYGHMVYTPQKRFSNCKDTKTLPFDFAIHDNYGNLRGLIEYDGEQHFRPIEFFGGEEGFGETQRRDAIKTKYCADNGIPLLRIPYVEFANIEAIVTNWITSLGGALQAA